MVSWTFPIDYKYEDALLCADCNSWMHAKCLGLTKAAFKYYLDNPDIDWICLSCSLPFATMDYPSETDANIQVNTTATDITMEASNFENDYANEDLPNSQVSSILEERRNNSSGALVAHLNINSIQNKLEELKLLNDELKAHIFIMSETKIDRSYPDDQFSLQGYRLYRKDRGKGGGGLIAYFSTAILSKKLKLPKAYKTLEALAVECSIGRREILFLALYRPPKQSRKKKDPRGSKYQQNVEDEMNDICQWACLQKQCVVILGDLNMDRLIPNRGEGKMLRDLEQVCNLTCLITEPTRVTMHSQTLLDVLLTNTPEMFTRCGVYNPEISDHYLIYGEMTDKVCKHKPKTIIFRQTKNTDFELFNEDLINAPWHVSDIFTSVDDKYDYWRGLFESVANQHAPIKKKRVREKDIPYMTQEWKRALRNKRKYAKKFAEDRTSENMELKRKYRNIATRERRKAIRAYWYTKADEHKSRPSKFYDTFKPFISNKIKESEAIHLKTEGDNAVKDQTEVAEILAKYFTNAALSIGGDHVNNIKEEDHSDHSSVKTIREAHKETNFEFKLFTVADVEQALEKINPKKSSGWDTGLPPKFLKNLAKGTAASLTSLYNNCIEQSTWPSAWKMGEWTPVFTKGDRQDARNYRPITSLIAVDKIFEFLLSNQVTSHYDETLYYRMTAYRKRHSCETTLLTLIEDWKQAVDSKQLVSVLSTDMSKAFDSLSHSLTVKKLEAYGFGERSLNLMRSFFDERLNRVKMCDATSDWTKIERGCPQGSSFGPLLWNIYQNDMSAHVKDVNLTMYADDHQMYVKGWEHETVQRRMKTQGQQALSWYSNNFLLANPDKFQSLNINPRKLDKDKSNKTLSINDLDIANTELIKLLGVHIY